MGHIPMFTLNIGHPKRKLVFQPSIFRCELSVSGRVLYIICLGLPPLPVTVANEGLKFILISYKIYNNPGGDCYWAGGQPKICPFLFSNHRQVSNF